MRLRALIAGVLWLCNLTCLSETKPIGHVPIPLSAPENYNNILPPRNAGISLQVRAEWLSNLGNGWASYIQTWNSFLPTELAASTLTHFYSLVVDEASTTGPGEPTLFRAFEWENIRLEFSSDARNVPWDFVATFAAHMAALTQRGFTGQYEALYVHMATEHSIRISLMVLQNYARS